MKRIPFVLREAAPLIESAYRSWQDDRAPRMGAALAYYVALSLAPTVLVLLDAISWAFGRPATASRFVPLVRDLVGYDGATAIRSLIEGSRRSSGGTTATVLGLLTAFLASSAVVSELRYAMDIIWRVPLRRSPGGIITMLKGINDRLVCFALVLASCLFLMISLTVNTWIFAAGRYMNSGATLPHAFVYITDWLVSIVVITALFAFMFKLLPRVPLHWGDVGVGAVGTALLFIVGKVLLGVYLGKAGIGDMYGTTASLIVVLVWVYYSAQVLYLGAEFTRAYAHRYGSLRGVKDHSSGL